MIKRVLIILVSVAALCLACGRQGKDTEMFFKEISSVDKLVLSSMSISKMGEYDDRSNWKIGRRIAVYSYNTYMQAYVDLSLLSSEDVSVDEKNKTVELNLPAIQTEFKGRDMNMKEEHYRVTGFRSQIGAEERAELKETMNKELKREVETDSRFRQALIKSAEEKARLYFAKLFRMHGYSVNVNFKQL